MSKTTLNPHLNKARKVIRNLKAINQREIATELRITQPAVSYGIKNGYLADIEKVLILLDLAGYEVKEKENDE